MTTTVTINAHLSTKKGVQVTLMDCVTEETIEEFVLQDGESAERAIYDNRLISILEIEK